MPSGYTECVGKGATFEQFVWTCARGMGALIMMRDDSMGTPVPERFEPSDYYAARVREDEDALSRLALMSDGEVLEVITKESANRRERNAKRVRENGDLRAKYTAMIAKVEAWAPPSPDHDGMKRFMLEQLNDSMRFDCSEPYQEDDVSQDVATWKRQERERLENSLARRRESLREEIERTEGRNEWIRQLRESVPQPASLKVES